MALAAPFCNDLFAALEETAAGRIVWRQVKPLIRGKIPYTPDTPAVRSILQQVRPSVRHVTLLTSQLVYVSFSIDIRLYVMFVS